MAATFFHVADQHDPSGKGMFSKPGRYTSEKYIIFSKKDEILYNKRQFQKGSSYPVLDINSKLEQQEKAKQEQKQKQDGSSTQKKSQIKDKNLLDQKEKHKKEESQPFFKQLDREKINKMKKDKNLPPPIGYYHPKHTEIDVKPHLVLDYINNFHNKTLPKQIPTKYSEDEKITHLLTQPIPERIHTNVHGMIAVEKMIPRPKNLFFANNNPHEKRFEAYNEPICWSRMVRQPSLELDKQLGREVRNMYIKKEYNPDYDPNFEIGRKTLGTSGPQFNLRVGRKPLKMQASTTNEDFYNSDFYRSLKNSQVLPKNLYPNIEKMLPREQDPTSPLPSFMQKFNNTRMAITGLHHKMLQENHFMDGRFQTPSSDFQQQTKKPKNKSVEDSLLSIEENENI